MTVVHINHPPGRNRRTASSVIRFFIARTMGNFAAFIQLVYMEP